MCLPIIRQRKVAGTPELARGLSVPWLTFCTSSKVKRLKVKVTRPLNAVTENQPYLRNRRTCKSPLAGVGYIVVITLQAAQLVAVVVIIINIKQGSFGISLYQQHTADNKKMTQINHRHKGNVSQTERVQCKYELFTNWSQRKCSCYMSHNATVNFMTKKMFIIKYLPLVISHKVE